MKHLTALIAIALTPASLTLAEDKPVFSGPQVGEKLAPLPVRGVYDDEVGKPFDYVKQADGKAVVLIFVHKLTRPSVAVTRLVMKYTAQRKKDELMGGVVFLGDDATVLEERLKRARHAMPKETPIGISVDGAEGPGSYGLNRNVTLTILVGKEQMVTANFALIQPSVQADVPKVVGAIVKLVGGKVPSLAELGARQYAPKKKNARKKPTPEQDPKLTELLRTVVQKSATPEAVDKAAKAVEEYCDKHPAARKRVGEITNRIIDAGKLEDYGTQRAREFLRKWARTFSKPREPKKKRDDAA